MAAPQPAALLVVDSDARIHALRDKADAAAFLGGR